MKELNSDSDEPLDQASQSFAIPLPFKMLATAIALCLIAFPATFIVLYARFPKEYVSPATLGLVPLMLAGTAILLFSLAPWRALGLQIRKVGFLEFERVVNGQAAETAGEFAELRAHIEELEQTSRRLDSMAPIAEHFEDMELVPLLIKFLQAFQPTAYSPLRIREWGSRQPGYERLKQASLTSLRRLLKKLVANGQATTTVSRAGNTLYRYST
jgi:hypothetical protein